MLDTNTYYLLFERPKKHQHANLEKLIKNGQHTCFYISEITSMEIHSVLGKYQRCGGSQICKCERNVMKERETIQCGNSWIVPMKKKLNRRLFRDLQKIINDAESCNGAIRANVLTLTPDAINEGKRLLRMYSNRFNFGSHDALIAGSCVVARRVDPQLILATSDKGLKAVLDADSIPYFDPNI